MITYTVTNPNGAVEDRGLSAIEAAQMILGHDGNRYELRHEAAYDVASEKCFQLYGTTRQGQRELSAFSNGAGGGRKLISTYAADEAAAWDAIAEMVLTADWGGLSAMTDADYDAMIAEAEAE